MYNVLPINLSTTICTHMWMCAFILSLLILYRCFFNVQNVGYFFIHSTRFPTTHLICKLHKLCYLYIVIVVVVHIGKHKTSICSLYNQRKHAFLSNEWTKRRTNEEMRNPVKMEYGKIRKWMSYQRDDEKEHRQSHTCALFIVFIF